MLGHLTHSTDNAKQQNGLGILSVEIFTIMFR